MSGVWVVLPAFNEAENLAELIPRLADVLAADESPQHRILVIDDGSTDGTEECLRELHRACSCLQTHRSVRNRGKSSALREGFTRAVDAGADVVVMMDADGQDDPAELPRLLDSLRKGSDLVTGARLQRQDRLVKRTTSKLYNAVTGLLTGAPGHDFNSGFKAMTAPVARDVSGMLYGELHRYITVIAYWLGYRVAEVTVAHRHRMHGRSKYGINRFWRGFLDLLTVKFLMSYEQRPSHLFGGIGVLSSLTGGFMLGYLLVERILGETVGDRPLLMAGVLLVVVGLQLLLFGLLAELIVYTRHRRAQDN